MREICTSGSGVGGPAGNRPGLPDTHRRSVNAGMSRHGNPPMRNSARFAHSDIQCVGQPRMYKCMNLAPF